MYVVWLLLPQLLPLVLLLLVLPGQAGQEVSSEAGLHWRAACLLHRHGCHGDNEVVIIFCKKINIFLIILCVCQHLSLLYDHLNHPQVKVGCAGLLLVSRNHVRNFHFSFEMIIHPCFPSFSSSPTSPSPAWKPGTPPCSRCPTCWSPTTTRPTPSSVKTPGSSGRSGLSFATYRSSDWDHDPQIMRIE